MPSIAAYHPQIVHFVIALLIMGVLFRLISLTGRFPFTSAAATTLILLGTLASVAAVTSGDQAHGPGGVGIRTGDADAVARLLIAGVFHQAAQDRQAGNGAASNELVDITARRFPEHLEFQLFAAEWQTDMMNDPAGAMRRLDALATAQAEPRLRVRAGRARVNALVAQGNLDGSRAVLQTLRTENPTDQQIQRRLDGLSR